MHTTSLLVAPPTEHDTIWCRLPAWLQPILLRALTAWQRPDAPWYQRAAADTVVFGRPWRCIPTRDGSGLYMLRFWISTPQQGDDQGFESGNSLLLHWMARADDDAAQHDHPWAFSATILQGGYREYEPSMDVHPAGDGPRYDERIREVRPGMLRHHQATDLHAVGELLDPAVEPLTGEIDVLRGSWSAVLTGPRVRAWGFHPPGKPRVGYREFLAEKSRAAVKEPSHV